MLPRKPRLFEPVWQPGGPLWGTREVAGKPADGAGGLSALNRCCVFEKCSGLNAFHNAEDDTTCMAVTTHDRRFALNPRKRHRSE